MTTDPDPPRPAAERGVLLLLGPAGSGKGTVAGRLLASGLIARHLSMGELLRAAVGDERRHAELNAVLGARWPHPDPHAEVARCLAGGLLIPDPWTEALIEVALRDPQLARQPWALDGYPRRVEAARHLLGALAGQDIPVRRVLDLRLSAAEVSRRLLARARPDDTPQAIAQRLDVYEREVTPTLAWLGGRLPAGTVQQIDANAAPDEVYRRVLDVMGTAADAGPPGLP
jgi:adenylate kinase